MKYRFESLEDRRVLASSAILATLLLLFSSSCSPPNDSNDAHSQLSNVVPEDEVFEESTNAPTSKDDPTEGKRSASFVSGVDSREEHLPAPNLAKGPLEDAYKIPGLF